jgi:N-acetylmuramic acid 6-phosphate etherase
VPASRIRYARLATEGANPRSRALDRMTPREIATLMNREDRRAVLAVGRVTAEIAAAVEMTVAAFRAGGRLVFIGAGTSGRLGVLEAAECPPTFGTPPRLVQAIIAGGRGAVFRSREGAEDDQIAARRAVRARVRRGDVVVGISASGVTPFVSAALTAARRQGAKTVLVVCSVERARGTRPAADIRIVPATGAEVLAGSTRLKAGTATKLVLNTLTTATMTGLGRVYGNQMVDLQPRSAKLRERALRLVADLAGVSRGRARAALKTSRGRVRLAVVMARGRQSAAAASHALGAAGGSLRLTLQTLRRK